MVYKALIEIGGYKPGEEVPEEKAKVWLQMYGKPPVEEISGKGERVEKEPESPSETMHDDYLSRNANVVVKNIKKDNLNKETLENLIRLEENNKNRESVLNALDEKLEEVI